MLLMKVTLLVLLTFVIKKEKLVYVHLEKGLTRCLGASGCTVYVLSFVWPNPVLCVGTGSRG